MKLLHAPIDKADYIVTNFDSLLVFTSKVSVATSAIIYYNSQI